MSVNAQELLVAFAMKPEEAVKYLASKGLVVTDSWRDLWKEANRRAFTVARSAGYDVLQDIRDALVKALEEGRTLAQFTKEITPVLQAKGWWGKAIDKDSGEIKPYSERSGRPVELGSPRRLRLIYEQNLQTGYMAGRYKGLMDAVQTHPFWQYVAILDSRTRPTHRAMNGRVFRYDDPAWGVAYPPNGWRCRCRVRPLGADYSGTVSTAKGYIETAQVPRLDGSSIRVKQLRLPGLAKPFQPDAGWDYNPAANFGEIGAKP